MAWILRKIALKLQEYNGWSISDDVNESADINYFINYALYKPTKTLTAGWFTHPEGRSFYDIADKTDIKVCQAPRYAREIDGTVIIPGVDEIFKPKLVIGVCGRRYPSGRKGDRLVEAVQQLDFVDLKFTHPSWGTGEKVRFEDLPEFYRSIDYLLVPSIVEGGPIPPGEAMKCGTPVIAPKKVGNMEIYDVIDYEIDDEVDLVRVLMELFTKKLNISDQVPYTWEEFAKQHYALFRKSLKAKSKGDNKDNKKA
ncbi:MAG: glycosyltransferase [Candidatus Aenigmatarchaeota archaeon]